jgi:hypothetical protein
LYLTRAISLLNTLKLKWSFWSLKSWTKKSRNTLKLRIQPHCSTA